MVPSAIGRWMRLSEQTACSTPEQPNSGTTNEHAMQGAGASSGAGLSPGGGRNTTRHPSVRSFARSALVHASLDVAQHMDADELYFHLARSPRRSPSVDERRLFGYRSFMRGVAGRSIPAAAKPAQPSFTAGVPRVPKHRSVPSKHSGEQSCVRPLRPASAPAETGPLVLDRSALSKLSSPEHAARVQHMCNELQQEDAWLRTELVRLRSGASA